MTLTRTSSGAPALVRLSNPLTRFALRRGLPAGPNLLMTVRGRSTGEPRTVPVAVVEIGERRYIIGAYGQVHWVRNLRAAGVAELVSHGRAERVAARELNRAEAEAFFGQALPGYIRRFPWFGRAFARLLFGLVGREVLDDPVRAAAAKPVFELRADPGA